MLQLPSEQWKKNMDKNHDLASPFKPSKNIPVGLYVLFIGESKNGLEIDSLVKLFKSD